MERLNVGVVGAGVMGRPMAARLLAAGHAVHVYNRTAGRVDGLVAQGAVRAATPAEAAARCDVVISSVSDPAAVEAVSLGPDGVLGGLRAEAVHCDMSTVSPEAADRVAAAYAERGRAFVHAPVLGSRRQIEQGVLMVFAGGSRDHVQRCRPAWGAFADRVWELQTPGQAAALKLACNTMIGATVLGLGQALLLASSGGVEPEVTLDVLTQSALGSPSVASKGRTLLDRNFDANFYVRHMVKDLSLAADAGRDLGCPLPLNAVARDLFVAAVQQGWGDLDYSAVVRVLELLRGAEVGQTGRPAVPRPPSGE